ncbi:MAG: hypothetical protein OEW19_15770, partial [Acidobacteriota bacterium]|nr:hypothetical protein [Acidobacteriota bacterium]
MRKSALIVVALFAGAGSAQAQSLADIARAEAARRKAVSQPSKVYTNEALRPDFTKPTPAPDSTPAAGTPATAAPAGP